MSPSPFLSGQEKFRKRKEEQISGQWSVGKRCVCQPPFFELARAFKAKFSLDTFSFDQISAKFHTWKQTIELILEGLEERSRSKSESWNSDQSK